MRFATLFAVAIVSMCIGLGAPASAVQIPPGSYRETCESITMSGGYLSARCQDIGGNWHQAQLDMGRCPGGPVANNNGVLVCGPGGYGIGRELPRGSWRVTCRDASLAHGRLEAECINAGGNWQSSQLDYDDCPTRLVGNLHGQLFCEGNDEGQALPGGSWRSSCRNAREVGSILYADCDEGNGNFMSSRVNTANCGDDGVRNLSGTLACADRRDEDGDRGNRGESNPIANLPLGSWRTSCRNAYQTGHVLYAQCNNGAGGWQNTSIDLRQCRGPLGNDHGNLVCQNRPGQYRRD